MGIREGELSGLAQRSDGSSADGGGLTAAQRANLALVNERLGVDDYTNPNMADTPEHLVEHGFTPGSRPPA